MLKSLLQKLVGDPNEKEVKKLWPLVEKANYAAAGFAELRDEDFPKKTAEFKARIEGGATVDDILPEAFGLVKAACEKLVGQTWEVRGDQYAWDIPAPYDVQILGGIVLHRRGIAEMKTGEGKTLVATMPLFLNALAGKGAFLVTVNDYLAKRDAEWMGGLYRFLGLTVGIIEHGQSTAQKKEAYGCDITYGTNNEFGFDYLRSNMAADPENVVQRHLNYAIVDEVDSILIDEARTPLIISAPAEESTQKYQKYSSLIPQLKANEHFNVDEKLKSATLTEAGVAEMERLLGMENIYTEAGFQEVHHIEQALKAHALFRLDVDYVVQDGEIVIVDEFTGRLMPGRRYSQGLHQAIEAKERVDVKRESRTLATISFQNYFRLFDKLAGMTGTAMTEAEEFEKIYGLRVYAIPTNKLVVRHDMSDSVYKNEQGKFAAAAKFVKKLHEKGQPVLIGTISIEKSEALSKILKKHDIPHNVLNAKAHEREAEIVKNAGQRGAVTIATNMAGRGTDIKLGHGVQELGGLYILGTERHESRRIDNQLRGRSGRQGDPGMSQFLVSMEDDLMRLFGSDRIARVMEALKLPEDMPIENKMVSNAIEGAQKKVEGRNFDIRKHLVEYDDVMNKQREVIYERRRIVLFSDNIKNDILLLLEQHAEGIVLNHIGNRERSEWNLQEIVETLRAIHRDPSAPVTTGDLESFKIEEEIIRFVKSWLWKEYEERELALPEPEIMRRVEKAIYLRTIDTLWMEHIDAMTSLREAVSMSGYAQRDPLIEYKREGYEAFMALLGAIQGNTVHNLFKVEIAQAAPAAAGAATGLMAASAPRTIRTNEDDIEEVLSGKHSVANAVIKEQQRTAPSGAPGRPIIAPVQEHPEHEGVGRNDLCPCGSGKKFKRCHG